VVDPAEHVVRQADAVDVPEALRRELLLGVGKVLVERLQEPPVEPQAGLRPRPVGREQHAVGVPRQEAAGRVGLAAQFVDPRGEVDVQVRPAVEPRTERLEVLAVVAHVGRDERGPRVAGHDAVAGGQELVAAGELRIVEAPLGPPVQFLPALVALVEGREEGRRVGRMHEDRQAEFAAGPPDRIPPVVVDPQERPGGVAVAKAEVLEDLHAARPAPLGVGEHLGGHPGKLRPLAVPRGRLVGAPPAAPVDVGEHHEAVAMPPVEVPDVGVEVVAPAAVEADADGDPVAVHHLHESVALFLVRPEPLAEVRVHVDDGKPGPFEQVSLDRDPGLRPEEPQREIAAVAAVERPGGGSGRAVGHGDRRLGAAGPQGGEPDRCGAARLRDHRPPVRVRRFSVRHRGSPGPETAVDSVPRHRPRSGSCLAERVVVVPQFSLHELGAFVRRDAQHSQERRQVEVGVDPLVIRRLIDRLEEAGHWIETPTRIRDEVLDLAKPLVVHGDSSAGKPAMAWGNEKPTWRTPVGIHHVGRWRRSNPQPPWLGHPGRRPRTARLPAGNSPVTVRTPPAVSSMRSGKSGRCPAFGDAGRCRVRVTRRRETRCGHLATAAGQPPKPL
jgi:hypothetical protein